MSDTTTGSASTGAATPSADSVGILGDAEAWFKTHIVDKVSLLWTKIKAAEADVETYTAAHPDIVVIAKEAEALAPPSIQAALNSGLALAEKASTMLNDLDAHAASLGVPMSTPKS